MKNKILPLLAALPTFLLFFAGCSSGPEPIRYGKDNCHFCKMTISDERFAAEIMTKKGKAYKFDDLKCLLSSIQTQKTDRNEIDKIYVSDFCAPYSLSEAHTCQYISSAELRSPMAGNIAAFANRDSADHYLNKLNGQLVSWDTLFK